MSSAKGLKALMGRSATVWDYLGSPWLRFRTFNDPVDLVFYALSLEKQRVVAIQVGSNDGTNDELGAYLKKEHWCAVLIEPVGYVFKRLAEKYGQARRVSLENVAIAEANGSRKFYYIAESGDNLPTWYDELGSFSLPVILKHADRIPNLRERIQIEEVPCRTFRNVCEKYGLHAVDIIQIDTEGYDFEIIKLIDLKQYRPKVVVYEHVHLSEVDRASARELFSEAGYASVQLDNDCIAIRSENLHNSRHLRRAYDLIRSSRPASSVDLWRC